MKLKSNLNKCTIKSLEKKGSRDAKRNAIRYGNDEKKFLSSPFFEQEISLCLVRIHKECELFAKQKIKLLKKINLFEKKKSKIEIRINSIVYELENHKKTLDDLSNFDVEINVEDINNYRLREASFLNYETTVENNKNYRLPGDSFLNDSEIVSKEFRMIEQQAQRDYIIDKILSEKNMLSKTIYKQNNKKIRLQDKTLVFDRKRNNCNSNLKIQYDIFIEKCKQHCYITISRLSAYWTGAIESYNNKSEIYSLFNNEEIFKDLYDQISKLEKIGRSGFHEYAESANTSKL